VRSLRTYARIRSLTTGTFNQIFKDQPAVRLSGANRSSRNLFAGMKPAHRVISTVLETLQTYCANKNPVNRRIPQNFHGISTFGKSYRQESKPQGLKPLAPSPDFAARLEAAPFQSGTRSSMVFRSEAKTQQVFRPVFSAWPFRPGVFRPCEGGRQKVNKRTCFGGPCFEGTLQRPKFFGIRLPNPVPWPGRLRTLKFANQPS
jgi:hypothetical protein